MVLSFYGLAVITRHFNAHTFDFRSNQTKASLAGLTDWLSLVKFIPRTPPPPLRQLCWNAAHRIIMIVSCAVEFYHVSPSLNSFSFGPNVQRVQMVWFQQARSRCRAYSNHIHVEAWNMSHCGCLCRNLHQICQCFLDRIWLEGTRVKTVASYCTYSNSCMKASVYTAVCKSRLC